MTMKLRLVSVFQLECVRGHDIIWCSIVEICEGFFEVGFELPGVGDRVC